MMDFFEPIHRTLMTMLVFIVLLMILDGMLTVYELQGGFTHEIHPALRNMIETDPVLFSGIKYSLLAAIVVTLYHFRHIWFTPAISVVFFVSYATVISLHILAIYHAQECSCWKETGHINPMVEFHINMHDNHRIR